MCLFPNQWMFYYWLKYNTKSEGLILWFLCFLYFLHFHWPICLGFPHLNGQCNRRKVWMDYDPSYWNQVINLFFFDAIFFIHWYLGKKRLSYLGCVSRFICKREQTINWKMKHNRHEYHIENVCAGITACLCFQAALCPNGKQTLQSKWKRRDIYMWVCGGEQQRW